MPSGIKTSGNGLVAAAEVAVHQAAPAVTKTQPRCILIVGGSPGTRDAAPVGDPVMEVWGLNDTAKEYLPRQSVHFDLHARSWWENPLNRGDDYVDWLKRFTGPIYSWQQQPDIPTMVAYPRAEMEAKFPRKYFTSSAAWMLALAISQLEPGDTLLLYGCDMGQSSQWEYIRQRTGIEYYLGVAEGRGINVVLPPECPLLHGDMYGVDDLAAPFKALSRSRLEQAIALTQREKSKINETATYVKGKLKAYEEILIKMEGV